MVQAEEKQKLHEYTIYPEESLTFDDLENSELVRERHPDFVDIERITDLPESTTCLEFTVSAYEQRGARAAAKTLWQPSSIPVR